MRSLIAAVVAAVCSVPAATYGQTAFYQIEHLPSLAPGELAFPYDINSVGDVVGESQRLDGTRSAALWSEGVVTDLGAALGTETSAACGINDSGLIVGQRGQSSGCAGPGPLGAARQAIFWDEFGSGELPDKSRFFDGAGAFAVNEADTIVGWSANDSGLAQGSSWGSTSLSGLLEHFPMAQAGTNIARGINDLEQAVGHSDQILFPFPRTQRAALWDQGSIIDLGSLREGYGSFAYAINNHGTVVGFSPAETEPRYNRTHAFSWQNGELVDLGSLVPGDNGSSHAFDINEWGLVVGSSDVVSIAGVHAVLWKGGTIVDLNDLIEDPNWTLLEARAVNDRGDIVGTGFVEGVGGNQVFKLTHLPAPEPTTGLMMAVGGLGLAGLAVGRKQ